MTVPESPIPVPEPAPGPAPKKNNTVVWIIVAVVAVLLICCVVVALALGGLLIFNRRVGGSNPPQVGPFLTTPIPVNPSGTQPASTGPLVVESFDPTNSNYPALPDLIPTWKDLKQPGSQSWTATVPANQPVVIMLGWCASTADVLTQNYQQIKWGLIVDGQAVDVSKLFVLNQQIPNQVCKSYVGVIRQWTGTSHKIVTTMTVAQKINDGFSDYAAGDYTDEYTVNVGR